MCSNKLVFISNRGDILKINRWLYLFQIVLILLFLLACNSNNSDSNNSTSDDATLTSIRITPNIADLSVNSSLQLSALGTFSDDSVHDVTELVTWTSTDTNMATVGDQSGSKGLVTGIDMGNATISVTDPETSITSSTLGNDCTISVTLASTTIEYLFPNNGNNWNDYISYDGRDRFSAADTACDSTVDPYCFHAGFMRYVDIPGKTSCTGMTADDFLGVFEWFCDDTTNPARMITSGIKTGKGLSDLIDFDTERWKSNIVVIREDGDFYTISESGYWCANPIVLNNDGSNGSDMAEGEIHIVTINPNATYTFGADKVSLLIKPGVTLTGSATPNETIIYGEYRSFIWAEGRLNAESDNMGIDLRYTSFSALNNISVINAMFDGIVLVYAIKNTLSNITASENGHDGIFMNSSPQNILKNVVANNNVRDGVFLTGADANMFTDITTNHNDYGIRVVTGSDNNVFNQVTAKNNDTSIYHRNSDSNVFSNVTTGNSTDGLFIVDSSDDNTFSSIIANGATNSGIHQEDSGNVVYNNMAVSASEYNIYLYTTYDNRFTGQLKLGTFGTNNCIVDTNINPGLIDETCANQGSSDAVLTTGIDLSTSFVTDSWELLAADSQIRDVVAIPDGNDVLTHTWINTSTTDFLKNAVEIPDDGIGNDNTLCESDETCLYTPNIGRYQGHGNLIEIGTIGTGGTLENITLMQHETNGY